MENRQCDGIVGGQQEVEYCNFDQRSRGKGGGGGGGGEDRSCKCRICFSSPVQDSFHSISAYIVSHHTIKFLTALLKFFIALKGTIFGTSRPHNFLVRVGKKLLSSLQRSFSSIINSFVLLLLRKEVERETFHCLDICSINEKIYNCSKHHRLLINPGNKKYPQT